MLQHHQGHLTLSNVCYPMIRVLCSEILLLQNGLIVAQRGCSEFGKSHVLRELLPRSKTHPDIGNGLVGHCG